MVAVVAAREADRALDLLNARGIPTWRASEVISGAEGVRLAGAHRN
jgi:phosphoribosylformylglycinamidine cyclo-ligase